MTLDKTNARDDKDIVEILNPNTKIDEVQMGINENALGVILDLLTDLYENPIEATVREVVSNAVDASVAANTKKTIKITLPTSLRSTFTVQDFGTGMSIETIKNVYSQYGVSSKRDDFSQIGAFGLGAKAPLAYCSEFNVVTTHKGITTSFTISRSET